MRIGIDLDNILADFTGNFLRFHNHVYGTSLKDQDLVSYRFRDVVGCTRDEEMEKFYAFYQTPFFLNIQPIPGSQDGISKLKSKYKLILVTARQNDIAQITNDWISRFFPSAFSEIYFMNHASRSGDRFNKAERCSDLGIRLVIEDSDKVAKECADKGILTILFDYPYNHKANLPVLVKRVYSWPEIVDTLLQPYGNSIVL